MFKIESLPVRILGTLDLLDRLDQSFHMLRRAVDYDLLAGIRLKSTPDLLVVAFIRRSWKLVIGELLLAHSLPQLALH